MPQRKLKQTDINRLAAPTDRSKLAYSDTAQPGLVLEVRKAGGRTYYFRYHDERRQQHQIKVADAHAVTLAAARESVLQMQNQRARGEDPAEARDQRRATPTLRNFLENEYIPYIESYKRSAQTDKLLVRHHLIPYFGDRPLDRVTKRDLVTRSQDLYAAGYKPATVNRFLVVIRYALNLALDWEVPGLSHNPLHRVGHYPDPGGQERFLSEAEVQRLTAALRDRNVPVLENLITLLLLTGARKSELLPARWSDVSFQGRVLHVDRSKNGKPRDIALGDGALTMIEKIAREQQSPYLFPSPKTGLPYKNVFGTWNRVRHDAGLPDVRIHDLRHSFASFLVNAGWSLYEVQRLLGHSSIKVTERYAHLKRDRLIQAADAANVVPARESRP